MNIILRSLLLLAPLLALTVAATSPLDEFSSNPAAEYDHEPFRTALRKNGDGSLFSAWLEDHVWDHTWAADREVFSMIVDAPRHRQLQLEEGENIVPHSGEDLVVTVTFRDIYKTIFFIAVAWLLGTVSVYIGLPSLVGEIFAGFLLGPPLADFVPYPGALVLAGNIGLIGLILESGIGLDVAQLKEVGSRALLLAIVGSSLPLVTGFAIGRWIGKDVKPSIAVGAAFAPSSLGVASAALSTGEVLNTPIGQLIVASSVFDDVFGLILLSNLQVFSDPDPVAFQYILPFLASFGYLIILGYLGITVLPKFIQQRILPLVSEESQEQLAFVLMMLLMIAYMLALNYSGASYLTGVFLAGMTFSQIHSVHASFVKYGRPILEWLLRIFFSATIGFQVPITKFKDPYVVKWGFALLLPVFAKMPLGLLVPRFQHKIPDDFPYNPYYRDVIVTALSMTCRGEFNFIVASHALSEGLFRPDVYSAVIFAVLFGSIVCPLVLSQVLRYYNEKSRDFLEGKHPIERIGNTCDGYRPLFLAIQARTPVHWSLQEGFERTLAEKGLLIIDHRNWHTLGTSKEAVDMTELFVQDTKVRVRVKGCFRGVSSRLSSRDLKKFVDDLDESETSTSSLKRSDTPDSSSTIEEGLDEGEQILLRCEEIREALTQVLKKDSPEDYAIQVTEWAAFVVEKKSSDESERDFGESNPMKRRFYSFVSMNEDDDNQDEEDAAEPTATADTQHDTNTQSRPGHHRRSSSRTAAFFRRSASSPLPPSAEEGPSLGCSDLWEKDNTCHNATRDGYTLSPDCKGYGIQNIAEGLGSDFVPPIPGRQGHSRAVSFDASLLLSHLTPNDERDRETTVIRDRLHGYVRHHQMQAVSKAED